MAGDWRRVMAEVLEAALGDSEPRPRSGLSTGRALAAGALLGTLGRVAAGRLLRRTTRKAAMKDAMTRSEEELEVRTVRRERDRVRLRKYVVTEEVQRTIPVRREEILVEEGPSPKRDADPASNHAELSSADEIVLYEEVPVIEKRVVPRERVRVVKDTHTDETEVVEEVRRERIDIETDADG